jgi:hypothetical protein
MTERFFILTPTPTGAVEVVPNQNTFTIFHDAEGKPLRWASGKEGVPLPKIGDQIKVDMNGIGPAVVKGYFVSEVEDGNYLGIMALHLKPPKWLVDQRKRDAQDKTRNHPNWVVEGIGCFFGTEIETSRETSPVL